MADDKKPKIDLKARLGKKTVQGPAGGGAVPPPVGIPKPAGVPMPPFGAQEEKKKRPKVDASDPYAAISREDAPVAAEPQAIRIEMGEEVVAAQKKGRVVMVVVALLTAALGAGLGFVFGGRMESSKQNEVAIQGAGELVKEIEKANAAADQMGEILKRVQQKLGNNEYPEKEIEELGGLRIEFDGTNLLGKGIGRFKGQVTMQLVTYTSKAQEANDQAVRLRTVLNVSKKPLEDYLAQQNVKTAQVKWGVILFNGKHGPIGEMKLIPEPFLVESDKKVKEKDKEGKETDKEVDYSYPPEFEIKAGGDKPIKLKRFEGKDYERRVLPIDPQSAEAVCPVDIKLVIAKEISALGETLRGREGTADQEKPGLIDTGEALMTTLRQIAAAGS